MKTENYYRKFNFKYGFLDDNTIWVLTPSQRIFNIDSLTLRVIMELNSGSNIDTVCKKYNLTEEEIYFILDKFYKEKAITNGDTEHGQIIFVTKKEDVYLYPLILFCITLGIIQIFYFKNFAKTFLMKNYYDAILVGVIGIIAAFFHELGHYLVIKQYFKPQFGFTFLFIFPAIYVKSTLAWCLPRNIRILINSSGLVFDLIMNTIAVAFVVVGNVALEYYVTPFLLLQYTRMSVVINPLFSGDGYWMLSDLLKVTNLRQKSMQNLLKFKFNIYTLFGLLSVGMMISSTIGFIWFVINLLRRVFVVFKTIFI